MAQENSNDSFMLSATNKEIGNHRSGRSNSRRSRNSISDGLNPILGPIPERMSNPPHLSKFVSGAFSSIFNKNEGRANRDNDKNPSSLNSQMSMGNTVMNNINDPFAGEREIPALISETIAKESFDKHRWAHQLKHVETGCVLVANEKLGGVFHQTVLLVIEHNDRDGTLGIIINRPLPGTLVDIASGPEAQIDAGLRTAFNGAKVSYGGPVMQDEYSVIHGYGEVDGSKKVAPGVFVGGSSELAFEIRKNNFDPTNSLFVKGHAAWVPNQLQREINRGVWYVAAASSDLLLRYAGAPTFVNDHPDDLWADILSAMGGHFSHIAAAYTGPGVSNLIIMFPL